MATSNKVTVELGRVPKERGVYSSSSKYYKDNIVEYEGSAYIAAPTYSVNDGNDGTQDSPEYYLTRAPFTTDHGTPNAGWRVFANGRHDFSTGEDISSVGIDSEPTAGSENLVQSGGVKTAIDNVAFSTEEKVNETGIDAVPTANSENLVESGGVKNAIIAVEALMKKTIDYDTYNYSILANGKFNTTSSFKHAAVAVNAGETYWIEVIEGKSTRYAFATSDVYSSGASIDLVSGTSVVSLDTSGLFAVNIPEGCTYLLFNVGTTSDVYIGGLYKPTDAKTHSTFSTGEVVSNIGIDDEPTDGSGKLVKSGGVKGAIDANVDYINFIKGKAFVKESFTPEAVYGIVKPDGTIEESSTYKYYAPVLLEAGKEIRLNSGDKAYVPSNAASIYKCTSEGVFIECLFTRGYNNGYYYVSYFNNTDNDIYVGICGKSAEMPYVICSLDDSVAESAFDDAVEEINTELKGKEDITVIDGTATCTDIREDKYIRYSDGKYTTAGSSTKARMYCFDVTTLVGNTVKARIGTFLDTVPAAISFFTDSETIGESTYIKESSVQSVVSADRYADYNAVVPAGAVIMCISHRYANLVTPTISIIDGGVKRSELNRDLASVRSNSSEALNKSVRALNAAGIGYGNPLFALSPYYYHYAANGFIMDNSEKAIASESLEDIEIAARLGFKFVEANVQRTSDNKFICIHGSSGAFGPEVKSKDENVITTADLQSTKINTKTAEWIRTYVTYDSYYEKYQTFIPTLEEFCEACRKYNIGLFAGVVGNVAATKLCISLMGNNVIIYGPPSNIREYFDGIVFSWNNSSEDTAESLMDKARAYGAPFICALGPTTISNAFADDDELKQFLHDMHSEGFYVSWASVYATEADSRKYLKWGFDISGSGHEVNMFDANYESFDLDDATRLPDITGTVADGVVTLAYNEQISCGSTDTISLGKGSLAIRFSGTLRVSFGSVGSRSITSDGSEVVVITDYFFKKSTGLEVLNNVSNSTVTIYSFVYKTSRC